MNFYLYAGLIYLFVSILLPLSLFSQQTKTAKKTKSSSTEKEFFQTEKDNLEKEKEREMGMMDAPDAELPGLAMTMKPTSSDFLTAIQLKDGRVVLGGRDYMPLQIHPDKILLSPRANQNLMIFCDSNGLW